MSPTVLRSAGFRLFFFSREEARMHVHVQHADGEAKFWLEPELDFEFVSRSETREHWFCESGFQGNACCGDAVLNPSMSRWGGRAGDS